MFSLFGSTTSTDLACSGPGIPPLSSLSPFLAVLLNPTTRIGSDQIYKLRYFLFFFVGIFNAISSEKKLSDLNAFPVKTYIDVRTVRFFSSLLNPDWSVQKCSHDINFLN